MAKVQRLSGFSDLSYIDKFAVRFSLDPDDVIKKSFNTVFNFLWMWKEQEEFNDRYSKIYNIMNNDSKRD